MENNTKFRQSRCVRKNSSSRKIIIEDVVTKDIEKLEPCLVQFSNGKLINPKGVSGELYKNVSSNIGKRKERCLKVNTPYLSYSGKNYGDDVATINKERLFLGVLDKNTNRMRLTEMSYFLVHPDVSALQNPEPSTKKMSTLKEQQSVLLGTFGGKKGRSALRKINEREVTIQDMSKALDTALEIIEPETVEAYESGVYDDILPPCHREAVKASDVYRLEEIISDEELFEFNDEAIDYLEGSKDTSNFSMLFCKTIAFNQLLTNEEEQAKFACVALFMEQLIKLLKSRRGEKEIFQNCPPLIKRKIFSEFTDGKGKVVSKTYSDKLIAHIIILALLCNGLEVGWVPLSMSLGVGSERIINIARAAGVTPLKDSGSVKLKIPLAKPVTERRKKVKRK